MMNSLRPRARPAGPLCRTLLVAVLALMPGARGVEAQQSEAPPYTTMAVQHPGTLRGHLVFAGERPKPTRLPVTADFSCCDVTPKWTETYVIGETGGLANGVVHITGIFAGKPMPTTTPVVDQLECVFRPHVVLGYCRSSVLFLNSDPVFHNVHGYLMRGWYSVFNMGMPNKGDRITKKLSTPGPVIIKCDAGHKWMTSYIYALENPYGALTATDGSFTIDGIPPGKRRMRVWHEMMGEISELVDIPPGGTIELTIEARRDRSPKLKVVQGPAVVAKEKLAGWLFPPSAVALPATPASATASAGPGPDHVAASPHPSEGAPEPTPTPADPGEDSGRTVMLVTMVMGGLAVLLVLLLVLQRRQGAPPRS